MRRVIRNCAYLQCNRSFFPIEGKEHIQKYCSKGHQKMAWKRKNWRRVLDANNALARSKTYKPQLKSCIVCKQEFLPLKYHPYRKYCTRKCRNKFNQTPEKREIWRKNWRINNLDKIKEKDYIYKAKIRFGTESKTLNKIAVIERDRGLCKLCNNPFQIIHHVKYSGKAEDLVCLCRACHASIHQKILVEPYWEGEYKF